MKMRLSTPAGPGAWLLAGAGCRGSPARDGGLRLHGGGSSVRRSSRRPRRRRASSATHAARAPRRRPARDASTQGSAQVERPASTAHQPRPRARASASASAHAVGVAHSRRRRTPRPRRRIRRPRRTRRRRTRRSTAATQPAQPRHTVIPSTRPFPTAAPETGGGGTAGLQDGLLFGIGGAAVLAGLGTLAYRRRLARRFAARPARPADRPAARTGSRPTASRNAVKPGLSSVRSRHSRLRRLFESLVISGVMTPEMQATFSIIRCAVRAAGTSRSRAIAAISGAASGRIRPATAARADTLRGYGMVTVSDWR